MKIRLLMSLTVGDRGYAPGEVVDWEDDEDAQRLLDAEYAALPDAAPKVAKPVPEASAKPTGKPKRGSRKDTQPTNEPPAGTDAGSEDGAGDDNYGEE